MKRKAILPAPPRAESNPVWPQSGEQAPYEKRRTVAACVGCRQKKRKCSGLRPTCDQCRKDKIDCVYDTAPGETVRSMQKTQNVKRENDLMTLTQLFWHLRTSSQADMTGTLAAIRSGTGPDEIVRILKDNVPENPSYECDNEDATVSETDTTSQVDSSLRSHPIHVATSSTNTITALQSGVQAFLLCTGSMFHIYEESVAQEMFNVVRPYIQSGGRLWPQRVVGSSVPTSIREALCSVCIMAAIGLQYTKDCIPALEFEPSMDNGTYEYADICYLTTKDLLEDLAEYNVIEATKVCAGMCTFNVIRHMTIAIAYADMGITIALAAYPDLREQPPDISEREWISHRRTMRTLLTLRASWLWVSLGNTPGNQPRHLVMKQCLTDKNDELPQDIIQQELAKVIQIEVDTLSNMESFESLPPQLLESTRNSLSLWHQQLPHWMRLDELIESHEAARGTRRTVFLVHLFYLSAYILLARLVYEQEGDRFAEMEQARTAISDGILAARTAARILQLQLDEQAIFQRCWLCEFIAYTSSLLLLHSAVYLKLSEHPKSVFLAELSYVKSCLDVLDYCGAVDDVGLRFSNIIRPFYDTFIAEGQQSEDKLPIIMPSDFEYIFAISASAPPHLQQAAQKLLKLVSQPFGQRQNLHKKGTLGAKFKPWLKLNEASTLLFNGTSHF